MELKYWLALSVSVLLCAPAYPVPLMVSCAPFMTGEATTSSASNALVWVLAWVGLWSLKASTYSSPATMVVFTDTTSVPAVLSHVPLG